MEENIAKIIGATYKLLDYFPEGDPLKNRAKERVLAILENITVADIEVLEKYLDLAKNQGWIDGMNFLIVTKEWDMVKKTTRPGLVGKKLKDNEIFVKPVRPRETKLENYSGRQEKILKMLERTQKAQVRDIIKEMPDVTKRTIRRDLEDLLKKRKITRIGEFNQVFYQKSDRTNLIS